MAASGRDGYGEIDSLASVACATALVGMLLPDGTPVDAVVPNCPVAEPAASLPKDVAVTRAALGLSAVSVGVLNHGR